MWLNFACNDLTLSKNNDFDWTGLSDTIKHTESEIYSTLNIKIVSLYTNMEMYHKFKGFF